MADVTALRKRIDDSGITMVSIANQTGISRETLYNRLNEEGEFKASEITALTKVLNLGMAEREQIFFSD